MMKHLIYAAALGAAALVAPAEASEAVVELAVGESTQLFLRGNPSTGFVWSVAECSDVVEVELGLEPAPPSSRPLCGAPCRTIVTIVGKAQGQGAVKLIYSRPWEKDASPSDTRTFIVTVK